MQVPFEAGAGPAVLGISNNGWIAGSLFQIVPAAPVISTDANGHPLPNSTFTQGSAATIYVSGTGEVSSSMPTGYATAGTQPGGYKPLLPVSVTIGGSPAFVQSMGNAPGQYGVTQINLIVPATVPAAAQPVVVTVGGVSSPPVMLNVQPAPATSGN